MFCFVRVSGVLRSGISLVKARPSFWIDTRPCKAPMIWVFFLTGLFCLAEIWGLGFRAWGFQGAGVGFVAAEAGSPQGIHVEPCSQEVGRSGGGVSEVDIDTTTHDSKTSMYSRSI